MKKVTLFFATAFFTFNLVGCANNIYEGRYAWDDGWREGTVAAIGVGAELAAEATKNCPSTDGMTQASGRYATIQYKKMGRSAWRTLPIPTESLWKTGDLLYINVQNCENPLQPRSVK